MNATIAPTNSSANKNDSDYDFHTILVLILIGCALLSVATVVSNGMFLLTFYKDPLKCLRTPSAIFIAGLTSANFLIGLIVEPAFVVMYVFFIYVGDQDFDRFYRLTEVLSFITMNSSVLIMLAIGVVQYLLIKHPAVYQSAVSQKSAVIGLVFIFVYSIFFAVLPEMTGINKFVFGVVDLIVHNTLLTVVIVILYTMIYFAFRKLAQQHRDADLEYNTAGQGSDSDQEHRYAEKDFVYGTIILTVVLMIAVWPLTITVFIASFHEYSVQIWIAWIVTFFFLLCKFAVDPFIFALRMRKYRKSLMLVVRRTCGCSYPPLPEARYRREGSGMENPPSEVEDMQVTVIDGHGGGLTQQQAAVV